LRLVIIGPRAAADDNDKKGEKDRMTDLSSSLKSQATALAENATDLTPDFEAVSASRFFDSDDQTVKEVQGRLSSRLDQEKLEALRRLVVVAFF
jgi:hypothetical protein